MQNTVYSFGQCTPLCILQFILFVYRTRIEYGVVLCYTRQQSIQVRPIRDSFADAIIYKQLPQGTRVSALGHASNKGIDPGVMLACHCHPSAEACWAHHLKFTQLIDVWSESALRNGSACKKPTYLSRAWAIRASLCPWCRQRLITITERRNRLCEHKGTCAWTAGTGKVSYSHEHGTLNAQTNSKFSLQTSCNYALKFILVL